MIYLKNIELILETPIDFFKWMNIIVYQAITNNEPKIFNVIKFQKWCLNCILIFY